MSKYYDWKKGINNEELDEVIDILRNNGVVIFPTDTVYGIGGNALSCDVVKKIYEYKCRPQEKALSILVKDKQEIKKYAEITNEIETKIIDKFMPGPITIILKKRANNTLDAVTADNQTIGIRIPNNEIVKRILEKCDFPIAAPSANISGCPSAVKLEEIVKDFDGKVDALIDGGECKEKVSSTIVKVVDGKIEILREGTVSIEEINDKVNS